MSTTATLLALLPYVSVQRQGLLDMRPRVCLMGSRGEGLNARIWQINLITRLRSAVSIMR